MCVGAECIPGCFCEKFEGLLGVTCPAANLTQVLPLAVFGNETGVGRLLLEKNFITSLPSGMMATTDTNVVFLSLVDNLITHIAVDAFRFFGRLENLFLNTNLLSSIPAGVFDFLPALVSLALNMNVLTALPVFPPSLRSLQQLSLGFNNITAAERIAIAALNSTLWFFAIAGNGLVSLPVDLFAGFRSLLFVDLSSNALTSVPEALLQPAVATLTTADFGVGPGCEKGILILVQYLTFLFFFATGQSAHSRAVLSRQRLGLPAHTNVCCLLQRGLTYCNAKKAEFCVLTGFLFVCFGVKSDLSKNRLNEIPEQFGSARHVSIL